MLKRIDHVGIVVDDLESASRLLRDVLGMTFVRSVEIPAARWRALDASGETLRDIDVPADLGSGRPT